MHNPTKDNIFISGTMDEIIQQIADIIKYHRLRFFGHLKRGCIPAPIAIQENGVF
jgi:hypothetical protein